MCGVCVCLQAEIGRCSIIDKGSKVLRRAVGVGSESVTQMEVVFPSCRVNPWQSQVTAHDTTLDL